MNAITGGMRARSAVRVASLVVTASSKAYAIPIADVVETMRPLPIERMAGVPNFLLGLSVIRGAPVPVVDLEAVVGVGRTEAISRFVSLKLGERRVAVAVGAVIGIRELDAASVEDMPPLLRDARAEVIEAIGVLDARLLLVLRASRLLPEDIWQKLSSGESPS
jgi:purine-binding chemotaxis protein CheW